MNNFIDNPVLSFIVAIVIFMAGFLLVSIAPQTIIFTGLLIFAGKVSMIMGGVFAILALFFMRG